MMEMPVYQIERVMGLEKHWERPKGEKMLGGAVRRGGGGKRQREE